jgi:hypothetical protein
LLIAVDISERREQHRWRFGVRIRIRVWIGVWIGSGLGVRIRRGVQLGIRGRLELERQWEWFLVRGWGSDQWHLAELRRCP